MKPRWEYDVIRLPDDTIEEWAKFLDNFGRAGWEAFMGQDRIVFLKRPLASRVSADTLDLSDAPDKRNAGRPAHRLGD